MDVYFEERESKKIDKQEYDSVVQFHMAIFSCIKYLKWN